MTVISGGDGRMRAWILVQVDSPNVVAQRLYEQLGREGGESWVVVRADVVDYEYNIMVAVDAQDPEVLRWVHSKIQELTGARKTVRFQVLEHFPWPPHDADGYITPAEFDAGHEKDCWPIKPGRQGSSPAFNPWG